jgi:hypothetical protein
MIMNLRSNYLNLARNLEQQELSSGGSCSAQVYAQLLAIYLLSNDLPNAKLLWKRILMVIKKDNQDLQALWTIGQQLIKRDLAGVYDSIDCHQWPAYLNNIIRELRQQTRFEAISLVTKSYTYIHRQRLQQLTCSKTDEEFQELIDKKNWILDDQGGVLINKTTEPIDALVGNHEQLQKLTEYVTFLEN